jgi:IclR family transcriptional regulator, pca regulon regulatory protein
VRCANESLHRERVARQSERLMSQSNHVQSLARGLAVIRSFDVDNPEQTLSEVAKRTDLTRATARRLLLTLTDLGYATTDGKRFSLTPAVLDIGYAYLSSLNIQQIAQPFLESLSEAAKESVSVSVLDGTDIVYVARVPTARIMTISLGLGTRLPAHCTSMGRVLLAELDDAVVEQRLPVALDALTDRTIVSRAELMAELGRVRGQGYALVDQELEIGVRSVAAPLRDSSGRATAAMNISTHAGRTTLEEVREHFLPMLLDAAAAVTNALRKR